MTALARAASLAAPRRGRVLLTVLLGIGAVGASMGLLATSGYLIVRAAQQPPILQLTVAIVGVRAFAIARALLRYAERLASHDLAFRVLADLRQRFYARLAPLVPAGLPGIRSGDMLSRFVSDVDQLQHLYLRVLTPPAVAAGIVLLAGGIGVLALPAAGAVLAGALVLAAVAVPLATVAASRSAARRQAPARAALTSEVVEAVGGAAELALLGQAGARIARIRAADRSLARLVRRDALAGGLATSLGTLVSGLAVVGVVAVGIPAVADGRMGAVDLGLLAMLALAAFEGVAPLPAAAQQLAACSVAAERLEEVVERPVPVADPPAPAAVPADGALEARALSFAYPGGRLVVDGVDVRIERGRAVAVVGPSGSGKSTLAELLVRFRDPTSGSVALGGVDVRRLAQDALRRAVLLAAQDAHVFTTSIRENLLLARRDATDAELLAALDAVGLGGFVAGLPGGLGAMAGEDGAQLSGGQRRRLLVARALVSGARMLILDEPAAHLDRPAVRALHERLAAERSHRGVLVVAHALAGLEGFDEICVLDGGRVAERGTHAELLVRGGAYARMALAQASLDA